MHLCPPSARWRSKSALPSKACRTNSALVSRAFSAAGQAASALPSMAVLQILQADLLRQMDEKGSDQSVVTDLRSATDPLQTLRSPFAPLSPQPRPLGDAWPRSQSRRDTYS